MTHIFDTSALLAHHLNEPGAQRFDDLMLDPSATVGVSALTLYEFETRLRREGLPLEDLRRVMHRYVSVLAAIVPVTADIAAIAASLRQETSARIAAVDCLIAATALSLGATLVHRDAHFAALPVGHPAQEALPDKA